MYVVVLKFAANRAQAGAWLEGHKQWLQRGFADGVFLLTGSLEPDAGGAIVAHNTSLAALRERVQDDPFVSANVVSPEIIAIEPSRADPRLEFLLG